MAPVLLQHVLCVLMLITLYQALATSAQLSVQPLTAWHGSDSASWKAEEGREEKSKWAGAEHLFFQALSFVLNLAVVAMSRLVLGSSTV